MVAGIMYVTVGLLHPFVSHHGGLSSTTSAVWVLTHSSPIGVSFFGLVGIAGISLPGCAYSCVLEPPAPRPREY